MQNDFDKYAIFFKPLNHQLNATSDDEGDHEGGPERYDENSDHGVRENSIRLKAKDSRKAQATTNFMAFNGEGWGRRIFLFMKSPNEGIFKFQSKNDALSSEVSCILKQTLGHGGQI